MDVTEKIEVLYELKSKGILSQKEFNREKRRILAICSSPNGVYVENQYKKSDVFFVLVCVVCIMGYIYTRYMANNDLSVTENVKKVVMQNNVQTEVNVTTNKEIYDLDEPIMLTVKWQTGDGSCLVLSNRVSKVLRDDGYVIAESNCLDGENMFQYSASLTTSKVGKQQIPGFALPDYQSSAHFIQIGGDDLLEKAIKDGNIDLVKRVIENDKLEDLWVEDGNALFALLKAHPKKALEVIKELGADVNAKDEKGTSLLIWAVVHKDDALVKYLLANGVDINYLDNKGRTAVMYAAIKNNTSAIKLLIDSKADLLKSRDGKWTAYKYAKELGHTKAAKMLYLDYDEILFFSCSSPSCFNCPEKKMKFKELMKDYPTLEVGYLPVDEYYTYISNKYEGNPVIKIRNSKTGDGYVIQRWNGKEVSSLMDKED